MKETVKCYKVVSIRAEDSQCVSAMASLLPEDWIEEYTEGQRTVARRGLLLAYTELGLAHTYASYNSLRVPCEIWEAEAEEAVPLAVGYLAGFPCSSYDLLGYWNQPGGASAVRQAAPLSRVIGRVIGARVIGARAITLKKKVK